MIVENGEIYLTKASGERKLTKLVMRDFETTPIRFAAPRGEGTVGVLEGLVVLGVVISLGAAAV